MTDPDPAARPPLPLRLSVPDRDRLAVHAIYALYAAAVVFAVPGMFGVFLAYLKRGDLRGSYLESHLVWQVRTFWIWLIVWLAGWASLLVLIGFPLLAAAALFLIYRIVKGWLILADGRPIERPEGFF